MNGHLPGRRGTQNEHCPRENRPLSWLTRPPLSEGY